MNTFHEPLSSKLSRVSGRNPRSLPDLSAYYRYIKYRDEQVRRTMRDVDRWNAHGSQAERCTSRWCDRGVTDIEYNLCDGHTHLRLELKEGYHLYNQSLIVHANPSTILFREVQLRQLYLERYGLRPNQKHDSWILSLVSDISWKDVRARGELINEKLVHRALNRPFYRTASEHFVRYSVKLARVCGCGACVANFPKETFFCKYF